MIEPLLDFLVASILISLTLHCWRDHRVSRLAGDFGWGYVLAALALLSLNRVLAIGDGLPELDIMSAFGLKAWKPTVLPGTAAAGFALLAIGLAQGAVAFRRLHTETIERRRAQDQVTDSKRRFLDVADISADWIWEFDDHNRITYISGRFKEITGLDPDEIAGKRWREADWVEPGTDSWKTHLDSLEARRPFRNFQFPYRHADGRTLCLSISGKPVFSADGTYRGYRGIGTDLTETTSARQQLERQERQISHTFAFEELIAQLSAEVGAQEPDQIDRAIKRAVAELGRFMDADQCYVCLFSRDHQTFRCFAEWVRDGGIHTPDEYHAVPTDWMPHWLSRMKAHKTYRLASPEQVPGKDLGLKTILRREGIQSLIEIPLAPAGHLTGFFGLTSRRKDPGWANDDVALLEIFADAIGGALGRLGMERAIRENERRLSTLLLNLPGGAYRLRRTGPPGAMPTELAFDQISTGCQTLLGFEPDVLTHMNTSQILTLVHPDDRTRVFREDVANTSDRPYKRTFRIITAEGRVKWVVDRGRLVRADGETRCVEGLLTDITESKVLEADYRRLESELVQAQKMELVGELASGIAHDFNNLLGAIDGFARFIHEDTEPGSELNRYADRIMTGCSRAQRLVGQLLTISSSPATQPKQVCVGEIADETEELLHGAFPASIKLSFLNECPDAVIHADPTQISQVLINLCVNAKDALAEAPGKIAVTIADARCTSSDVRNGPRRQIGTLEPDRDYVEIRVTDTGPGIAKSVLDRVFEPHYSTKDCDSGHGLGLAVVERIVGLYGGVIVVQSEPGHGSTFSVFLPRATAATLPEAGEAASVPCHGAGAG